MTTRLVVTGTPGRPYAGFAAKPSTRSSGPFDRLSVNGTPGRRYKGFVAKPPSGLTGVKGVGDFTRLALIATPGRRYAGFIAKPAGPVVEPTPTPAPAPAGGGGALPGTTYGGHRKAWREAMLAQAREEDELLIEIITAIVRLL